MSVHHGNFVGVFDEQVGFLCTPKSIPDHSKWNLFYECCSITSEMGGDRIMNFIMSGGTLKPFLLSLF